MSEVYGVSTLDERNEHGNEEQNPFRPVVNEYAVLKQLIKQKGLLEKQPRYYTYKILSSLALMGVGIVFLLLVHTFWLQLLDAVFLAFACGQVAFVCHDSGHRQIFNATRRNDLLFLLQGPALLEMSYAWWLDTHNAHHSHPNELDMDPDISIPALCYSEEEARSRHGLWRFLREYQAFFFFPFTLLVSIEFQRSSIFYLMKHPVKYYWAEVSLLLLHYVLYFWLVRRGDQGALSVAE